MKFQKPNPKSQTNFNIQFFNDPNISISRHFFVWNLVFEHWNLFMIYHLSFEIFIFGWGLMFFSSSVRNGNVTISRLRKYSNTSLAATSFTMLAATELVKPQQP